MCTECVQYARRKPVGSSMPVSAYFLHTLLRSNLKADEAGNTLFVFFVVDVFFCGDGIMAHS